MNHKPNSKVVKKGVFSYVFEGTLKISCRCTMDPEEILSHVGSLGRYQKLIVALLCLPIFLATCHVYLQVFAAGKSDHWCKSWVNDDCPTDLLDDVDFNCEDFKKSMSIPIIIDEYNSTKYDQCTKYDVSGIDLQTAIDLGDDVTKLEVIPCDEGWEYDRSTFPSTIIQDFELVCGMSYLPNIAQSVYFVGYMVGSALPGVTADLIGRRWTFLLCASFITLTGIANTFSLNVWMFIALRFLTAVFGKGINLVCFIIVVEIVAPSKRVMVSNLMWVAFAVAYFALAALAKTIPNWRILQLVVSIPYLPILVLAIIFLPETPRWLLSKQRFASAEKILRRMAKFNGKELPENFSKEISSCNENDNEQSGIKTVIRQLLGSRTLLLITVNMNLNWIVQSLVYYGLSLSTSSLGVDPYIAFCISGTIEIPAYILCMFIPEWFGRKLSTSVTMVAAGVCCCVTPLIPLGIWRALVAMSGKFFITISFSVVYNWGSELLPTTIRSSGMGFFSMISRVGSITAPIILLLENVWPNLPVLVFGACSILAGIFCLVMPETKGKPLPNTIQDTKALYRNSQPVEMKQAPEKETTDSQPNSKNVV
ncbi:solute carrier family 22 member 6-B-like [Apostichopus japonicus]|uniref:solute carrier family 22 member 6-B-like n=1 Tax=Stichopus japonicus TaxID=307972 RepID=UPI003AB87C3F